MKLNICTQIDLDTLDSALKDFAENVEGIEFNKTAMNIIDILLYRSGNLGEEQDLFDRIEKSVKRFKKKYRC